jgi:hypothetical protein
MRERLELRLMALPEPEAMPERLIHRSGLFIISFQLDGLCTALRYTVPAGLQPAAGTVALLRKLYDDYASISTKRQLAGFPDINDDLSSVDLLSVAETLRSTVLAFLSPDELADRKRALGFAAAEPSRAERAESPASD